MKVSSLLKKIRPAPVDPLPPLPPFDTKALDDVYVQLIRTIVWRERLIEATERMHQHDGR